MSQDLHQNTFEQTMMIIWVIQIMGYNSGDGERYEEAQRSKKQNIEK